MNVKLTAKQKIKVTGSASIYSIMQQILKRENKIDRDKEHFWIVCLSANNSILMIELISLGSVKATIVEPMDVFSFALQKRAVSIILVHNHPSGEMKPSRADINLTEKMLAIGSFVDVPVIDHLIISEKAYMSFADDGLIKKMEEDNRYDLTFSELDLLRNDMKNIQRKQKTEIRKEKLNIAKKMLEHGDSVKKIISITGLTEKDVERLKGK